MQKQYKGKPKYKAVEDTTPSIRIPYKYRIFKDGKELEQTIYYRLYYKNGLLFRVENSFNVSILETSERYLYMNKHFGTWEKAQQESLRQLSTQTSHRPPAVSKPI